MKIDFIEDVEGTPVVVIYNSLQEHKMKLPLIVSIENFEKVEDELAEFVEDELEEHGVYEYDGDVGIVENEYLIQLDDEEDWLENFNLVVGKVSK
jgi:hypothetical protein